MLRTNLRVCPGCGYRTRLLHKLLRHERDCNKVWSKKEVWLPHG